MLSCSVHKVAFGQYSNSQLSFNIDPSSYFEQKSAQSLLVSFIWIMGFRYWIGKNFKGHLIQSHHFLDEEMDAHRG